MAEACPFKTEAELVEAFLEIVRIDGEAGRQKWVVYPETGGFDLLLVDPKTGVQVGIEAKLRLNAKVIAQALPHSGWHDMGPDYRAVLIPRGCCSSDMSAIAAHLGITVLSVFNLRLYAQRPHWTVDPPLVDEDDLSPWNARLWFNWIPAQRLPLPDYIPDVAAGVSAPRQLTQWKIKAIKLMIVLERRGYVTRRDMRALKINATIWTCHRGYLEPSIHRGGYVRCDRTPDFRAHHPVNYAEIEADYDEWSKSVDAGRLL